VSESKIELPPVNGSRVPHLDVQALHRRVEEIFTARMKQPMPDAPILSATLTIRLLRGKPADVDVEFCRGEIERGHHEVVKELRVRGIDPTTGEFLLRPLDAGLLQDRQTGAETPQVRFQYIWAPHDKVEECSPKAKPTLVTG
jgi:hypothetical protein